MKKMTGMIMVFATTAALLAAVACGGNGAAPIPTQPPPTERPVDTITPGGPVEPITVEAPAPIEDSTVVAPAISGGEYILKITSGLPSGCARLNGYRVERDGKRFDVVVTNLVPGPDEMVACTAIYGYHEGEVVLGSGLEAGETYTVTVNGAAAHSFIAR